MPQNARRTAAGVALLAACLGTTGCVPEGLAFRVDKRLTFVSPEDRATVRLPLTIDWDIRDFQVTGPGGTVTPDSGYFALFLDRPPMPPGESLTWVARKDRSCRASDGCPDAEYLSDRGVFTTTETQLTLEQVPRSGRDDRRERHWATIVLVDADGRRIGESAFELAFDVERGARS